LLADSPEDKDLAVDVLNNLNYGWELLAARTKNEG
jgi:hypothetical protein